MMQHIDHISFCPYPSVSAVLVEESMVSVFAFCDVPFVEILAHDHEAHFVAEFYKLFCRHVVRGADGVAAHILEDGQLASDGSLVDCRSERAEIVMEAYSAELAAFSVEEEALVGTDLYCPESESRCGSVLKDIAVRD